MTEQSDYRERMRQRLRRQTAPAAEADPSVEEILAAAAQRTRPASRSYDRHTWEQKAVIGGQRVKEQREAYRAQIVEAGVQACRTCGVTKPLDGFGIRTYPTGWWTWKSNCRECEAQTQRATTQKRHGGAG